jgi:hypothetical protein
MRLVFRQCSNRRAIVTAMVLNIDLPIFFSATQTPLASANSDVHHL